MSQRIGPAVAALLVAALVASCSSSGGGTRASSSTAPTSSTTSSTTTTTAAPASVVPGAAWATVDPTAAGFDPTELAAVVRTAQLGSSRCLAVIRDGKLAGQWYFQGRTPTTVQDIFSATKSITSTLIAIAQADGKLSIDDKASKWISQWRGTPSDVVTVRDLLSNTSGRYWSLASDYGSLIQASDRTAYAVGLSQADPPGTVWAYNNAAIQTLQVVLSKATGIDPVTYAQQRLFGPLGMTHTKMTRDKAGNAQTFEGVQSTCQDMARFGLLFLDHGRWGDRQIVPASWVAQATRSSSKLNAAYGYLWWVNHEGHVASPTAASSLTGAASRTGYTGRLVAGAPDDMFWAIGLGNQIVQIDPGSRTVVVRLGPATPRPKPPTFGPAEASKVVTEAVAR